MITVQEPSFFSEWFGLHGGREVFYANRKTREFIETPHQLEDYVISCKHSRLPAYMSVQPYQNRDQLFGLEKLFFDFDCEGNLENAWKEAKAFVSSLMKFYAVKPLIVFSGRKGYHVYMFFNRIVQFPTWRTELIKSVYEDLQRKILKGLEFKTLDPAPLGDVKRLARIPYSVHEATGLSCQPVNLSREPITVQSLEEYREKGLETKILETLGKEIVLREKRLKSLLEKRKNKTFKHNRRIRPCLETALSLPLNGGEGHKIRLAIAIEYLNKGFSVSQVVELFRSQIDFKEDKTHYFVKDAERKHYRPFRCITIKKLGFCLGRSCSIYNKKKQALILAGA